MSALQNRSPAVPSAALAPRIVLVPGWQGSEPGHWQSLWAERLPGAVKVQPSDWHFPSRAAWVQALTQVIQAQDGSVVLAAHSLGCMAVAHLPDAVARQVKGALLVAPADPLRRSALADFAPVPFQPLPYRSILVASTKDPFCPIRLAGAYARAWGSDFLRLPDAGHINVASGYGEWPLGLALLQSLLVEPAVPAAQSVTVLASDSTARPAAAVAMPLGHEA